MIPMTRAAASIAAVVVAGVLSATAAQAAYEAYVCGLPANDPTLNLRACPNTGCDILLAVPNGTGVIVHGRAGVRWVFVEAVGVEGYMSSKYLCR